MFSLLELYYATLKADLTETVHIKVYLQVLKVRVHIIHCSWG